jgi:hypothetical protein
MNREESGSFLKKRTKKLLTVFCAGDVETSRGKTRKSFFGSFFSKKEPLSFSERKVVDAGLRRDDACGLGK